MKLTFIKTLVATALFLISHSSGATTYIAIKSGNFSDTATWYGNVVPPATLDANWIRIPGGVTVNLDRNIILNSRYSRIEFFYNGTPWGKIVSTSNNYIAVDSGDIRGQGNIDIDSMYVGNLSFPMSGTLALNKFTINAIEINPVYSINIKIRKELRLAGGDSKITRSAAVVELDTNADIVYTGGIVAIGPNSLDVSKGYNLRYTSINYVHHSFPNVNTLNEFEVAVGAGNTLRMTADMLIPKKLLLTSGSLKTDGYRLIFAPGSTIVPGGDGVITGTTATNVIVQSTAASFGPVRFSGATGTVKVESNTNVLLGSGLFISNLLELKTGNIQLNGNNIELSSAATIIGGTDTSYIITNDGGSLKQHIHGSMGALYPVGTSQHYAPVFIGNNTANAYADLGINVSDTVFANGTYGYDLASVRPVVNSCWTVTGTGSQVDYNITPQWRSAEEKNGFNAAACFVSQYTNNGWDTAVATAAGNSGNMKTVTRNLVNRFGKFIVANSNTFTSVTAFAGNDNAIKLYPNPANDIIFINAPALHNTEAGIYNIAGTHIRAVTLKSGINSIDISGLKNGMYLLRCDDGTSTKFVKQ